MRVTVTTSPGARVFSILSSWRRSRCAQVSFSRKILVQPAPRSCSSWASTRGSSAPIIDRDAVILSPLRFLSIPDLPQR
jgi:hypothetical protein